MQALLFVSFRSKIKQPSNTEKYIKSNSHDKIFRIDLHRGTLFHSIFLKIHFILFS